MCSVVEIRDSDSVPRPLAKRVGSIRKIPRLQPLGIKSFVFEPPLTQRLRVAFWIASAVQHSIDDHNIVYDPIPNNEREPLRESIVPSVGLGVDSRIQQH